MQARDHGQGRGHEHGAAGRPAPARASAALRRVAVREVFAVALLALLLAATLRERWLDEHGARAHDSTPAGARIERHLAAMGTHLTVAVEAPTRAAALAASEAAIAAVLAAEQRLSNWRADSELVRLFPLGAPAPAPAELRDARGASPALAADLAALAPLVAASAGAFDPRASAGRGGPFGAIDSGGFGKGRALDLAAAAAGASGATHVVVDLGGQVLVSGDDRERSVALADPRDRSRAVVEVATRRASLATSSQGERPGHIVDPSSSTSVAFDGAVTVFADDALAADVFSTALLVHGRERALELAPRLGIDVLVLEPRGATLVVHASAGLAGRVRTLVADAVLALPHAPSPSTCPSPTSPTDLHSAVPVG